MFGLFPKRNLFEEYAGMVLVTFSKGKFGDQFPDDLLQDSFKIIKKQIDDYDKYVPSHIKREEKRQAKITGVDGKSTMLKHAAGVLTFSILGQEIFEDLHGKDICSQWRIDVESANSRDQSDDPDQQIIRLANKYGTP